MNVDTDTLGETTLGATNARPAPREGEVPAQIGRYTVLKAVGAGGMGVVYAAYDTDLDRKLAIKLLHHGVAEVGPGTVGHSRLLREAQAMAKISHPNVLQVFEVGVHHGQVFLALEFVEGTTLEGWLTARPRTWREILGVFIQAGRGLEAAHAVGLVHRDFKPENVLVDAQDRVRVMDFGLARAAGTADPDGARVPLSLSTTSALRTHLTVTGAVMGTPLYMSPEQHTGGIADARSDEFAFCVALYDALYGQRPFAGDDIKTLAINVLQGLVREPPRGKKIPSWLRAVLFRGLSPDPDERYPGMTPLLAELARDRAAARRRWLLAGTAAASLAVGAWGVVHARADRCGGAAQQLVDVWDPPRADAVAAALRASGRPYAERTWSKVQVHLDEYTRAWTDLHVSACETHARGESSDDLFDLAMVCLARRRSELGALVDRLAHADGEVVDRAVTAVRSLTPISVCDDREALLARVRPPEDPTLRAAVDRLRAELDAAKAAQDAGKFADGLALASATAVAADATGHRPLIAEARLRLGELHSRASEFPSAEAALMAALWAAEAGRHDEAAAATWTELVRLGVRQGRFVDAERAAERAGAAVARLGGDPTLAASARGLDGVAEARLANELGSLAFHNDRGPEAVTRYERALALREQVLGADHPDTLSTLANLGNALFKADRIDEAIAATERALRLREEVLGPDHPDVATTLNNLGVIYRTVQRTDDAIAAYDRAIAIWRAALGPDNPTVVNAILNLANIHLDREQPARAQPLLEEAVAITKRTLPEDNPLRLTALNNLGGFYSHVGQTDRAEQILRESLAVRERLYGPDSPKLAESLTNLGVLTLQREDEAAAQPLLERALALLERNAGSEHSDLVGPLNNLAVLAISRGQLDVAETHVRHARRILDKLGGENRRSTSVVVLEGILELERGHPDRALPLLEQCHAATGDQRLDSLARADLDFALARTLVLTRGDTARARTLAQQARTAFVDHAMPRHTAAVEAWLARQR